MSRPSNTTLLTSARTARVYRYAPYCLPYRTTRSAFGMDFSQLHSPARWYRCLRFGPHLAVRYNRKTRGQSGSLLLLCKALSSSTSCPSPGALSNVPCQMYLSNYSTTKCPDLFPPNCNAASAIT
jgi:hypothetical protein